MPIVNPMFSCKTTFNGKEWEFRTRAIHGNDAEKRVAEKMLCGNKSSGPSDAGSFVLMIMAEIAGTKVPFGQNDMAGLKERCSCDLIEGTGVRPGLVKPK